MAKCAACSSTIIMGGVRDGELRFCNETCHQRGALVSVAAQVPEDLVFGEAQRVHAGLCPKCGGAGPVDVHESHQVWSALIVTSWKTNQTLGCRSCGVKAQLMDLATSAVAGWWGIPWGLVMTPVQIIRNIGALVRPPDPLEVSEKLHNLVRMGLAAHAVSQQQGTPTA